MPTQLIAARQAAFELSGATFGGMKATIDAGGDVTKLGFGAKALTDWAHALPGLFPAGSDGGTTKALPTVWSDRAGFEAAARELRDRRRRSSATWRGRRHAPGSRRNGPWCAARAGRATTSIASRTSRVVRALVAAALLLAAPAFAQTAPAPTAEAEALGRRVADTGTLAALLPLLIARDTEAMIAEHPELDDAARPSCGASPPTPRRPRSTGCSARSGINMRCGCRSRT